jgi:phosphopantetheine adenylyltransferase
VAGSVEHVEQLDEAGDKAMNGMVSEDLKKKEKHKNISECNNRPTNLSRFDSNFQSYFLCQFCSIFSINFIFIFT